MTFIQILFICVGISIAYYVLRQYNEQQEEKLQKAKKLAKIKAALNIALYVNIELQDLHIAVIDACADIKMKMLTRSERRKYIDDNIMDLRFSGASFQSLKWKDYQGLCMVIQHISDKLEVPITDKEYLFMTCESIIPMFKFTHHWKVIDFKVIQFLLANKEFDELQQYMEDSVESRITFIETIINKLKDEADSINPNSCNC